MIVKPSSPVSVSVASDEEEDVAKPVGWPKSY